MVVRVTTWAVHPSISVLISIFHQLIKPGKRWLFIRNHMIWLFTHSCTSILCCCVCSCSWRTKLNISSWQKFVIRFRVAVFTTRGKSKPQLNIINKLFVRFLFIVCKIANVKCMYYSKSIPVIWNNPSKPLIQTLNVCIIRKISRSIFFKV